MTQSTNGRGTLMVLFSVLFWGWSFVATKILVAEIPVSRIVAFRILVAVPPMAVAAFLMKAWPRRLTSRDGRTILFAAMVLLVHWTIQFTGIRSTTATNSGWMVGAAPLSISFFAWAFLRERITSWQMAGMSVATAGLLLLVSHGRLGNLDWLGNTGDWLVLASIVLWGIYTATTRDLARRHPPLGVTTILLAITGLPPAVYVAASGGLPDILTLSGRGVAALLFLALGSSFLALWFWSEGIARLGAARAGYFLYLLPLFTTALAVPYLHEPFGPATAAGGLLVLVGVALAERRKKRTAKAAAPAPND